MARRGAPALTGPWAGAWAVLASPWTAFVAALGVAAAAIYGLTTAPGGHPAEGLLMQVPAVLLPFSLLARALDGGARRMWLVTAWCAGLALALLGAYLAGAQAGVAEVGFARPTENFERQVAGRTTKAHLGGQLTAQLDGDAVALKLGTKEHVVGEARLPLTGTAETTLGPWAIHLRDVAPGDEAAVARLKLTPRAGGEAIEAAVRTGSGLSLPDGASLAVLRLSADFGRALGAAARIQIDHEKGNAVAWHFVESPDVDRRIGTSPWIVELLAIESEPRITMGVRRQGTTTVALIGWALMAGVLLAVAFGERRA